MRGRGPTWTATVTQLEQFSEAESLRAYAEAVARRAGRTLDPDKRVKAEAWAAWIHTEADRHDSTLKDGLLAFEEPEEGRSWDLDKYMPRGMSASRPGLMGPRRFTGTLSARAGARRRDTSRQRGAPNTTLSRGGVHRSGR